MIISMATHDSDFYTFPDKDLTPDYVMLPIVWNDRVGIHAFFTRFLYCGGGHQH